MHACFLFKHFTIFDGMSFNVAYACVSEYVRMGVFMSVAVKFIEHNEEREWQRPMKVEMICQNTE